MHNRHLLSMTLLALACGCAPVPPVMPKSESAQAGKAKYPCPSVPERIYDDCGCPPDVTFLVEAIDKTNVSEDVKTRVTKCAEGKLEAGASSKGQEIGSARASLRACLEEERGLDPEYKKALTDVLKKFSEREPDDKDRAAYRACRYGESGGTGETSKAGCPDLSGTWKAEHRILTIPANHACDFQVEQPDDGHEHTVEFNYDPAKGVYRTTVTRIRKSDGCRAVLVGELTALPPTKLMSIARLEPAVTRCGLPATWSEQLNWSRIQ